MSEVTSTSILYNAHGGQIEIRWGRDIPEIAEHINHDLTLLYDRSKRAKIIGCIIPMPAGFAAAQERIAELDAVIELMLQITSEFKDELWNWHVVEKQAIAALEKGGK